MKPFFCYFLAIGMLFSCTRTQRPTKVSRTDPVWNPELNFRPNILWIVVEDQSPNIPAFGDSTVVTPTLNRLAAEGVCYDYFYSAHPVCAPARASIITGRYANSIGASHMRTGPWFAANITQEIIQNYKALPEGNIPYEAVPPKEVKMFTEYLRAAGYYCSNNAKEDYQFRKTMTAWDESSNMAHWRNRPKGKPFFSVFNIGVTHESRIWAKAKDSLWVPKNLEVPVPPYLPNTETGRKDVRRMYSNILEMDAQTAKILQELKADGLLDSTIVVWYTDHGGPLPRQKRLLYDSGTKVPMIIRFPNGEFAGMRDDRMVSFIDLAPTMLSLVGIKPPDYMQGTAFLGEYLRTEEPEFIFGAADRFDEFTDNIRSVRDKQFRYIKNYNPEKPLYADVAYRKNMPIMRELLRLKEENQLTVAQALWFERPRPEEELYDVINDSYEVHNLAQLPEYREKLLSLRKACSNWVGRINDTGLRPEQELIDMFWPNGEQPNTSNPELEHSNGTITISCATEGASIGYQIVGADQEGWTVYIKPFSVKGGTTIKAVAHRLGYKRSAMETFEVK